MGSLKKNMRKGKKKSKKYKKYRRQKGGDAYSLEKSLREIQRCVWKKRMDKQQKEEEKYILNTKTVLEKLDKLNDEEREKEKKKIKREVKEYLYFLPKETEPAEDQQDDSKTVINTFIRLSKLINGDLKDLTNDDIDQYLKDYFNMDIPPKKSFKDVKDEIITEIGEPPKYNLGNFKEFIKTLTIEGDNTEAINEINKMLGKDGPTIKSSSELYKTIKTNQSEQIKKKIKYLEELKASLDTANFDHLKNLIKNKFKRYKKCEDDDEDSDNPQGMLCEAESLNDMIEKDIELESLLHSAYLAAKELEESYELYASETEKKYNFHKIVKDIVMFIIDNVHDFEELKDYAAFFIDEKEMFKLFFKYRIENPEENNILHVAYAYLTKQTHKTIPYIIEDNSYVDGLETFLKTVLPEKFEEVLEKALYYWYYKCKSENGRRSSRSEFNKFQEKLGGPQEFIKELHNSMLGCDVLFKNDSIELSGGGRKKTKKKSRKKNKLKGGTGVSIINNAIQEILVDIAKEAFKEDPQDFEHDSSHDNLITRSYSKEDQNTLEAKCSDGVTVSEKIKSFGKFFLINDKGLPDEKVYANPCGKSFNSNLSFVIDAGSFKQFRPYHKNNCENDPNFTTTKNVSNYVDPAATGKGDLYRCYTVLSQSGNDEAEKAIDGANRFVKLCVAFTRALIIDVESKKSRQKIEYHDLKPTFDDYEYIFKYLEEIKIEKIDKSDLVCLYENERFKWEGNQSPMASFINSVIGNQKIADPRSKNDKSDFLKTFFEKVDNDNKAKNKKEIKIGMCRILKYMGDKSHIIACIILILLTKNPYIVQTIDRLLSKAIIQVIEYCKSKTDNNYKSISKNLGVMISGGELNKPPKYAQGLPAYLNLFNNNNFDFVTNPYNILFLYFTGDPITAKKGIIKEICKNLAEFAQVFTQIKNDPKVEPIRTIYYVTSMCLDQAKIETGEENKYKGADKESLIKGQLEEVLVTNEDYSPTKPISIINSIIPKRDDELELTKLGTKLVEAAGQVSNQEEQLDTFIKDLTNEDLFKFMSLYKKVESVKKNKDDFERLYKKYVENRPGGLNYLLKQKTYMRAPRVSTVKYRVEQEGGHSDYIWNDKKKEGLFPPFNVINPEIRFSEYYKLLSLSFEEPKYGTDDQRLEIKKHCKQLVEYVEKLEESLKNEGYVYDDTLYGVIKLSLGYEDPTPESDGGTLANHRYAIAKNFEEGTLTGFINRAQGFITSITKIVELSRNIYNEPPPATATAP
jgi:hypothetical protein